MIIDRSMLAGDKAYLRAGGATNLVGATLPATSTPIGRGMALSVSGVTLVVEHDDLASLFANRGSTLIGLKIRKEILPGLFSDPYAHRVHRIAGFDDLGQGTAKFFRTMEIQGQVALVSTSVGETCQWRSQVYRMPAPIRIDAAAWDLMSTKLTPSDAFSYSVRLMYWTGAQDPSTVTAAVVQLAQSANPQVDRFANVGDASGLSNVSAYQLVFEAVVRQDSVIEERHRRLGHDTLGRPMLTALHLVERVDSAFAFQSLSEVVARSATYHVFDHGDGAAGRLMAQVSVRAVLTENESIEIDVIDTSAGFTRVEAHVDGEIQLRPPVTPVED